MANYLGGKEHTYHYNRAIKALAYLIDCEN